MDTPFYFYLVPASSGKATLHIKGCSVLNHHRDRIFLGSLYRTHQALSLARRHSPDVLVCPFCLGE